MKKSRFTESQIVNKLHVSEKGLPLQELIRKHRIIGGAFYWWRVKNSGIEASSPILPKEYIEDP